MEWAEGYQFGLKRYLLRGQNLSYSAGQRGVIYARGIC